MRMSISASDGLLYVNLASVWPEPYFTLSFQFDAKKPVVGAQTSAIVSYRSGAQIYQSRDGEAVVTSVTLT
jgi:hypothetical protein